MKMTLVRSMIVATGAVAALACVAAADFNTGLQAGGFNSDGAAGAAANGVYSFTYTDPTASFNQIRVRGAATTGGVGSFLNELRWQLVLDAGTRNSGQLIPGTTWVGTQAVDNTQSVTSFSLTNGNTYSFRLWESFDDGGVDAVWNDLQFDLSTFVPPPPPCTVIPGQFSGTYDINTFGSDYDTEIGLYDSTGALLGSNDDVGGLQSQLTGSIPNGTYYLAVGGFNTTFAGGFSVISGAAAGNTVLSINGQQVAAGAHAANSTEWYCFTVPTPGSLSILALGGLAAIRRRR